MRLGPFWGGENQTSSFSVVERLSMEKRKLRSRRTKRGGVLLLQLLKFYGRYIGRKINLKSR